MKTVALCAIVHTLATKPSERTFDCTQVARYIRRACQNFNAEVREVDFARVVLAERSGVDWTKGSNGDLFIGHHSN